MRCSPTCFDILQQRINIINENHLFHHWHARKVLNELYLVKYLQYSQICHNKTIIDIVSQAKPQMEPLGKRNHSVSALS